MNHPRWKNAVTYADAPHECGLRDQCAAAFDIYKNRIREAGVAEKFTLRGRTAPTVTITATLATNTGSSASCSTVRKLAGDVKDLAASLLSTVSLSEMHFCFSYTSYI
jgi:hypothetical protein